MFKKNVEPHLLPCIVQLCVFQVVFYQKQNLLKFNLVVKLRCANNDYTFGLMATLYFYKALTYKKYMQAKINQLNVNTIISIISFVILKCNNVILLLAIKYNFPQPWRFRRGSYFIASNKITLLLYLWSRVKYKFLSLSTSTSLSRLNELREGFLHLLKKTFGLYHREISRQYDHNSECTSPKKYLTSLNMSATALGTPP